jgi:hypothetical protein
MTLTTKPMPTTQNQAWGFWGAMHEHASAAWPLALNAVSNATGESLEAVQSFLDSRHGRHFADDVHNGLYRGQTLADAIQAATQQWLAWTVDRQTSKQFGIPRGLPYLTGFVIHCDAMEPSAEDSQAA